MKTLLLACACVLAAICLSGCIGGGDDKTYRVEGVALPVGTVVTLDDGRYGTAVSAGDDCRWVIENDSITTLTGHKLTFTAYVANVTYFDQIKYFDFDADRRYNTGNTYLLPNFNKTR